MSGTTRTDGNHQVLLGRRSVPGLCRRATPRRDSFPGVQAFCVESGLRERRTHRGGNRSTRRDGGVRRLRRLLASVPRWTGARASLCDVASRRTACCVECQAEIGAATSCGWGHRAQSEGLGRSREDAQRCLTLRSTRRAPTWLIHRFATSSSRPCSPRSATTSSSLAPVSACRADRRSLAPGIARAAHGRGPRALRGPASHREFLAAFESSTSRMSSPAR